MPPIRPELLDELLKDYQKPEDLLGQDGLLQQLTKALVERALDGELTHHLGYEKHDAAGDNSGNSRNGTTPKTMRGKRGQVQIDVPRDRTSEFEPQLVKKGQTRFDGLDEKIISLYSRGMTQREIQGHLEEIYGVEVSPSLISTVTDAVLDEVRAWQSRPLDAVYPILYLDALQVKVKSQGRVHEQGHLPGLRRQPLMGLKEVLGMWASETEGAKFWMQIVTELKNRGVWCCCSARRSSLVIGTLRVSVSFVGFTTLLPFSLHVRCTVMTASSHLMSSAWSATDSPHRSPASIPVARNA